MLNGLLWTPGYSLCMGATELQRRCRCDECRDRYDILQELYIFIPAGKAGEKRCNNGDGSKVEPCIWKKRGAAIIRSLSSLLIEKERKSWFKKATTARDTTCSSNDLTFIVQMQALNAIFPCWPSSRVVPSGPPILPCATQQHASHAPFFSCSWRMPPAQLAKGIWPIR